MARMTPAEATAVNVLVSYIAGLNNDPPAEIVHALETLAKRRGRPIAQAPGATRHPMRA